MSFLQVERWWHRARDRVVSLPFLPTR